MLFRSPIVDKTELEAAIKDAEAIEADKYTQDSYSALAEALDAARTVLADESAAQGQVNEAVESLRAAIENLVEIEPEPGTDEPGTDEPGTDEPGTDKPGTDKPDPGKTPDNKPGQTDTVQTGDASPVMLYVMITAVAFIVIFGAATVIIKRRKG